MLFGCKRATAQNAVARRLFRKWDDLLSVMPHGLHLRLMIFDQSGKRLRVPEIIVHIMHPAANLFVKSTD